MENPNIQLLKKWENAQVKTYFSSLKIDFHYPNLKIWLMQLTLIDGSWCPFPSNNGYCQLERFCKMYVRWSLNVWWTMIKEIFKSRVQQIELQVLVIALDLMVGTLMTCHNSQWSFITMRTIEDLGSQFLYLLNYRQNSH